MGDNQRGYTYSSALKSWEPSPPSSALGSASFSCLTWNVWYNDYGFAERAEGLLDELEERNVDVIALQEVTPALLRLLTQRSWIRRDYALSEVEPQAIGDYGLLFMSRRPPRRIRRMPLPSNMKRYALLAEFDTPEGIAVIATVHLESMGFQEAVRGKQIEALFAELEGYSQAIVLGDFNFCSSCAKENDRLDPRYLDLWPVQHPDMAGYTEDTAINSMRLAQKRKTKQVRFDRILLRDDHHRWRPQSIEMLGVRALGPELFISDHFGLTANLVADQHDAQRLLMLGQDHHGYGTFSQGALGAAVACISVGGDKQSPSMAFKANKAQPNEDALLVKRRDDLYLLAIADSHFGIEASHRLLHRLAARDLPETRLDLLQTCLAIQKPHEDASSGTTLIVCLFDAGSGHVLAVATGDSTMATLDEAGWRVHNEHNSQYVRLDGLSYPDTWSEVELWLKPGDLLVLHTDGIDECHYRKPETSIRPTHIMEIWKGVSDGPMEQRTRRFCSALTQTALDGVDGNPGGQDNIALLAIAHHLGLTLL